MPTKAPAATGLPTSWVRSGGGGAVVCHGTGDRKTLLCVFITFIANFSSMVKISVDYSGFLGGVLACKRVCVQCADPVEYTDNLYKEDIFRGVVVVPFCCTMTNQLSRMLQ